MSSRLLPDVPCGTSVTNGEPPWSVSFSSSPRTVSCGDSYVGLVMPDIMQTMVNSLKGTLPIMPVGLIVTHRDVLFELLASVCQQHGLQPVRFVRRDALEAPEPAVTLLDVRCPDWPTPVELGPSIIAVVEPDEASARALTRIAQACRAVVATTDGRADVQLGLSRVLHGQHSATAAGVSVLFAALRTLGRETSMPATGELESLTMAERRVLTAVASGQTNREIALHLGVSVKTIEAQLSSLFRRLRVRTRAQAAAMWTAQQGTAPHHIGRTSRPQ